MAAYQSGTAISPTLMRTESNTDTRRGALLIRMGPYDMTQAVPRSAAALEELGYSITILSLDPYGTKPRRESVNGWRVFWHHHSYRSGNKLSFLWAWLCWWIWVIRRIWEGRYNIIQAFNLESLVPCVLTRPFRRFKVIYDVRDPWGMNSPDSRSFVMRTLKSMERWAAAHTDGMVLSQGILDRTGIYFGAKVCSRIPTVQVLNVPGRDIAGGFDSPNGQGIRLNFSGHISYVRNAQAIMDLATQKPQVTVDVVGDIRDAELRSSLEKIPNARLYGRLPFDEAMALLRQANLISVMYDTSTEIAVVASANKMFEAMMMSRPYVASQKGFPGVIAERYGVGWAVPYGDSQALIRLVGELEAEPERISVVARAGRKAYEDHFTWDKQKANLVLLYNIVTGKNRADYFSYAGWHKLSGTVLKLEHSNGGLIGCNTN